ncbi:MAG: HPP family protein [Sulfuritalea sp.]|jgi:CBS-domain-containing membrane protein|nr:HPP family protein [Sulfuritalea sp.]
MSNRNPAPQSPWQKMLGIELSPVSHRERLVSALGGFVGLLVVFLASHVLGGAPSAPLVIFSIGASAVLVFGVPHGALSQPWPVLGGHLVSALIGVACAHLVPDTALAAAVAVGLSIAAMHYLRCIHPPGGATALAAVLGGESLRGLGFGFVLSPVLLNVMVILAAAVAFNALFPWRRYPAFLAEPASAGYAAISHEDFVYALAELDSFIDVSEDDLLRIYGLATGRHRAVEAQVAAAA